MDFLLRVFTPRKVLIFFLAVLILALWRRFGVYPRSWYVSLRYPPQGMASSAGSDIMAELQRLESRRVELRYAQVNALLDQAEKEGYAVHGLRAEAKAALGLNTATYRNQALHILSEVEMSVPRKP